MMTMHLTLIIRSLGLLGASLAFAAAANEVAVAPVLDRSGLAPLGATWLKGNPYRGNPRALEVGQSAFNQSCARCHGTDANPGGGTPAPDLRQLNRYCRSIANPALQTACMADNDQYFKKSVQEGKLIVGVRHMPNWKEVLTQEDIWAIQAFIESKIDARTQ
jgi:mono/diheme cytochrome c family protein